MEILFPL